MNHLYWIIALVVVLDYLWGLLLGLLNRRASHKPIPEALRDIYDQERYLRQQAYFRCNSRLGILESSISSLILLLFFLLGGFGWLHQTVSQVSDSEMVRSLLFFGFLYVVSFVLSLPLDIYRTFIIEERFGFNRTTPRLFFTDCVKSFFLNALILGLILSAVVASYLMMENLFFLVAWIAVLVFSLFMQLFYSDLIVPLFNRQTPLEEGGLRQRISDFARRVSFRLSDIYIMDSSKRSTKANAYFTGFGRKRRVVLYDTLRQMLTDSEITAVLAHEIGHYKNGHLVKSLLTGSLSTLLMFWILSLVISSDYLALAAGCQDGASFHVNLTIFALLYTPMSTVLGIISNGLSRRHERQADAFARKEGLGKDIASALRKMSSKDLANLTPHPLVVWTSYSHPTLLERVCFLEEGE